MRILIAEDDEVWRDGLCRSMRQSGYAVDCVGNGKDAVQMLLGEHSFDLVILDLGLPSSTALSVLQQLRVHNQHVPVIILTARDGVEDRVKGLDLGADDYLIKPFNLPELEARVRALLRRGQCGASPMLAVWGADFRQRRAACDHQRRGAGTYPARTGRAGSPAVAHRRVVSKEQLLEHLYSYDEEASSNAIEVYIHRLRKKIEAAGVTIRTIRGLGYLWITFDKASCLSNQADTGTNPTGST